MRSKGPNIIRARYRRARSAGDPRQGFFRRKLGSLTAGAPLQLDLARGGGARADDNLPGMPHQIRIGEFHAGAVLPVVVKGGAVQLSVELLAQRVAGRVAALQIEDGRLERSDAVRPDDAGFVVAGLDPRAHQAGDADAV